MDFTLPETVLYSNFYSSSHCVLTSHYSNKARPVFLTNGKNLKRLQWADQFKEWISPKSITDSIPKA